MSSPLPIPAPLQSFDDKAAALQSSLASLATTHARYTTLNQRNAILPNSLDALRVELTYHSNAIEGSTLTLRETQLVLEGRSPANKSLREVYEARNHDRALRMVEEWAATRPASVPLTEQDLLAVHAHVMADIDTPSAGRLRTERVLIQGTRFIPPGSHKFGELLPALLSLANRPGIHPVAQAAELHYNLVAVHPFNDGNGRTARLLMNYHLMRNGYPFAIIEVERRAEYLAALEEANTGRWEPFATYLIQSLDRTMHRLIGSE
ncbi:MAG TPA: Fic family protein [Phycisphaerales bacterium]|nr:Fic family protein [Phycisphaerales bacterium]